MVALKAHKDEGRPWMWRLMATIMVMRTFRGLTGSAMLVAFTFSGLCTAVYFLCILVGVPVTLFVLDARKPRIQVKGSYSWALLIMMLAMFATTCSIAQIELGSKSINSLVMSLFMGVVSRARKRCSSASYTHSRTHTMRTQRTVHDGVSPDLPEGMRRAE